MSALLTEIKAKCSAALLAGRDPQAIADVVNVGRVKASALKIGNGTVLEAIGMTAGNSLLDVINNTATFRYVKPMVNDGRLSIDAALTQTMVQSLVPSVLTQAQADTLCALGKAPDPISEFDVRRALYADNGTWLGG